MALNILLLDDDPVAGVLAERLLERLGNPAPTRAMETTSALAWRRFDVVLIDADTLHAQHRQVFDALMQDVSRPRPHIILMRTDTSRFDGSAADAQLAKPLTLPALAKALNDVDAADANNLPDDFDAVHRRELMDAFGRDGVKQLVDALAADMPHRQAQFALAQRERDPQLLRRWAHALKGACQQMGARELATKAATVEAQANVETALAGGERLLKGYIDLVARWQDEVASLQGSSD